MAVYNIFPSADATLYSRYPLKNTGRDPILEISAKNSQDGLRFLFRNPLTENPYYTYDLAANSNYDNTDAYFPGSDIRRAILQFSPADIAKVKTFASQSISGSWQATLKLFLASAQNLNTTYSLDAYAVSQSWSMGTGQFAQVPESQNGVSWVYTGPANNSPLWAQTGSSYLPDYSGSQFFDYMSNKDINMNISDIVSGWFSYPTPFVYAVNNLSTENSELLLTENDNLLTTENVQGISNYGILLKHPSYIEENTASFVDLKFFSVDTHTIYPPTIEFKWDDSNYYPQGTNYVLNDQITITIANNPGQFRRDQVYKMRTAVRYTYPPRTFSTSSAYLNSLYLSENSYWALQDVKTEEMVVDFDENYTKLSADSLSNYFTLYTSGLEVNRFYRLLIKTRIYSTTYGPLSLYDNEQSIYNALSLYGPEDLRLLPAEEVIYSGQNLVFKIIE